MEISHLKYGILVWNTCMKTIGMEILINSSLFRVVL